MKYPWILLIVFLAECAGCGNRPDLAKTFPNGAVTHVAFAENGNSLVAVNEFSFYTRDRDKCHTRLRRFQTSDWKLAVDSGELSLIDFTLAACDGPLWAAQAQEFDRLGLGNPLGGVAIYRVNTGSLRLDTAAVIKPSEDSLSPSGIAQSNAKPLCAVNWERLGGSSTSKEPRPSAFLFDLKAGKKNFDLEDFPTMTKREDFFTKTVIEFTPDGKNIVSCYPSRPFQVQLHAAETGKLTGSMKLDSPATALKYSRNGKMLAALCLDGTVLILRPDLSKSIHILKVDKQKEGRGYQSPHSLVFPDNENLAVISGSDKIELFETKDWKSVRTLSIDKNQFNCLAASQDGRWIAAGLGRQCMYPTKIRVFEVKTGKLVAELD